MSKHRRPSRTPLSRTAHRLGGRRGRWLPEPLGELLAWAALGCVLVPLVLVWSGVRWSAALEVAGLLLGLVGACAVALRLSSATTPPPPPDGPDADFREVT